MSLVATGSEPRARAGWKGTAAPQKGSVSNGVLWILVRGARRELPKKYPRIRPAVRVKRVGMHACTRRFIAMQIATIGLDIAKQVFQVHGAVRSGKQYCAE